MRTLPDPKGQWDNTSTSPREAGNDRRTEVRLAIHASAPKLAWCLALPGPMPTAPAVMPRGADQRCLRFSTARAQARADDSALRLEGGDDVAHAAFFNIFCHGRKKHNPCRHQGSQLMVRALALHQAHRPTHTRRLTSLAPMPAEALGTACCTDAATFNSSHSTSA